MSSNIAPLEFAKVVTDRANAAWEDGSFMDSVTPTTRNLLTYWFDDAYADMREVNFHIGQRQAILNIIYIHEVLKKDKISDVYVDLAPNLLLTKGFGIEQLHEDIYSIPKYCVKTLGCRKSPEVNRFYICQYTF